MVNALINGIFKLILMLASAILGPLVAIISALLPDLGTAVTNVLSFLAQILINVPMILDLLFVPHNLIVLLFNYYAIKYTIYISVRGVKACINIYNKFKT